MTANERVRGMYKVMRDAYGKDHADDMILNILYREQEAGNMTYDEASKLHNELTKEPAKKKAVKITFKRVDDFTLEAEAEGHTAEIRYSYFGLGVSYVLYIDEVRHWSYDKLSEARRAGKEELERRIRKDADR